MRTYYPDGSQQSDFVVPREKVDQEHSEEARNETCNSYPCDAVWDAGRNLDPGENRHN